MKYWVGVTDNQWFSHLAARRPDEVNFWQPSATPPFKGAPMGLPFLFKLKRPGNKIAGGGFFVTYSTLPLSLAWEVFGDKNGASTFEEFRGLVAPLMRSSGCISDVGCTVLSNPFFIEAESWIEPLGWSANIVRGKMYSTEEPSGATIWDAICLHLQASNREPDPLPGQTIREPERKYGQPVLVAPRLGQSSFRVLVTDAYKRRCAITGENTLVALEAAHIVPYGGDGTHDVSNGLLLRADFHRLFDTGLVTVTPDYRVKISPLIREAYFNGKAYYRMNDMQLAVTPDRLASRPDPDRLDWHNKNCFQA